MSFPAYAYVGRNNRGRLNPAEVLDSPGAGKPAWWQFGARRTLTEPRPFYHLVWPKDKKRGRMGRLKDIIQGKGPDIHLTMSANKHDYMTNRPLHGRWSGWETLDQRMRPGPSMWQGQYKLPAPCWVKNTSAFGRKPAMLYNFATRKFEKFHPSMWTDAIWQGPHKHDGWPDQHRDVFGHWWEDRNWDPSAPGQNMRSC